MTTVEQLHTDLGKTYKLIHFADLSNITDQHGSAFRLLKSLHKDSFEPNERIVFYSSQQPTQLVLDHLQLAASRIDISNWFIMICGPKDIATELQRANSKFGHDDVSISWHSVELDPTNDISDPNIYPHDTMCFLPFNSLNITTDSYVTPCCKYQQYLGNVETQTLEEIMHSPEAVELRRMFKQGIKPSACQVCWDAEAAGSTSNRQTFLTKFQDVADLYHVDDPRVRHLSTSQSIICNFKCRICDHRASSSIAAEDITFADNETVKKQLSLRIQDKSSINISDYVRKIDPVLADIEDLHILGGEPLLMKNLIPLLDHIVQLGHHQHINIVVNTNSSIWNNQIVNQLLKFQHTEILLSIDDIGNRFELQRGGSWIEVDQNIQKWAGLQNATVKVKVAPTVNIQNVLYLNQLVDYCSLHNLEMVWCYLEHPRELCIDNLTTDAKELVYSKYKNHSVEELRAIANRVISTAPVSGQAFLDLMNKYDQRRNTDFYSAHKEIVDAMSKE